MGKLIDTFFFLYKHYTISVSFIFPRNWVTCSGVQLHTWAIDTRLQLRKSRLIASSSGTSSKFSAFYLNLNSLKIELLLAPRTKT